MQWNLTEETTPVNYPWCYNPDNVYLGWFPTMWPISSFLRIKEIKRSEGLEMARRLRALYALVKDPSSVPRILIRHFIDTCNSRSGGSDTLFWTLAGKLISTVWVTVLMWKRGQTSSNMFLGIYLTEFLSQGMDKYYLGVTDMTLTMAKNHSCLSTHMCTCLQTNTQIHISKSKQISFY